MNEGGSKKEWSEEGKVKKYKSQKERRDGTKGRGV